MPYSQRKFWNPCRCPKQKQRDRLMHPTIVFGKRSSLATQSATASSSLLFRLLVCTAGHRAPHGVRGGKMCSSFARPKRPSTQDTAHVCAVVRGRLLGTRSPAG